MIAEKIYQEIASEVLKHLDSVIDNIKQELKNAGIYMEIDKKKVLAVMVSNLDLSDATNMQNVDMNSNIEEVEEKTNVDVVKPNKETLHNNTTQNVVSDDVIDLHKQEIKDTNQITAETNKEEKEQNTQNNAQKQNSDKEEQELNTNEIDSLLDEDETTTDTSKTQEQEIVKEKANEQQKENADNETLNNKDKDDDEELNLDELEEELFEESNTKNETISPEKSSNVTKEEKEENDNSIDIDEDELDSLLDDL